MQQPRFSIRKCDSQSQLVFSWLVQPALQLLCCLLYSPACYIERQKNPPGAQLSGALVRDPANYAIGLREALYLLHRKAASLLA